MTCGYFGLQIPMNWFVIEKAREKPTHYVHCETSKTGQNLSLSCLNERTHFKCGYKTSYQMQGIPSVPASLRC